MKSMVLKSADVFVERAVIEFKEKYPATVKHRARLNWAVRFVKQGCVQHNADGSHTVHTVSRKLKYAVVNKTCDCRIATPCAHRIAVCIAQRASELQQAREVVRM